MSTTPALSRDELEIVVQVNGKVRGKISVPASADNAEIEAMAKSQENVQRFLADTTIRKVIVVPQKLVNIVAQ
jgi:leucyl-tRNA synthetase